MPSEFKESFARVHVERTVQAAFNDLKNLFSARDTYRRRWIWELLQNASDAAGSTGVRVLVHVSDSELRFSHSGRPFTPDDIGHLIYAGSTKQRDEGATGRFGTGFMTTHLISKQVQFFLMEHVGGDPRPADGEMERVRWCPIGEALRRLSFETERRVVRLAAERLDPSA